MAIIDTPVTLAELQASIRRIIATSIDRTYQQLVRAHAQLWEMVWNNPQLSPQQVMDALGTQAYKLFELSASLIAYIRSIDPASTYSPVVPYAYEINPDGTATIGEPIQQG